MKLTQNEIKMIKQIAEADTRDGGDLTNAVYTDFAVEGFGRAAGGTMGSLVKKGLAWTTGYGYDDTCALTEEGAEVYLSQIKSTPDEITRTATTFNAYAVLNAWTHEGISCVEIQCNDYDHLKTLPEAVMYNDKVHVRTGWNSDTHRAYYKTGQNYCTPVR